MLQAELVTDADPDLPCLKQADKNADHEVKILRGRVAGRGWEAEASLAEEHVQRALLLHDPGSQWAVKYRDHHAQQQSCHFDNHCSIDSKHGK
jgi:hypothetical protein